MKRMLPAILIAAFLTFALSPVQCSAGAEVSVPQTVKIVMVGDILLHSRVEDAARDANGNYNFDFIFANMKSEIAAADIAIVCPHWGTEYNLGIDASQKKWTKVFREGGADLVIGTHPHVLEPVEFLQDDIPGIGNNRGNGDMLVYYSLGNFVNWTSGTGEGTTNRMVGGMAKINISMSSAKETAISGYGIEPVVCHVSSGYKGVTVYPLSTYTEELAAQNEIKRQDASFSREKCEELCKKLFQ